MLLDAAREVFAESGFDGATVRAIAARASVDPSMINHWFGGKQNLFAQAVLRLPFQPGDFVATAVAGPLDGLGDRLLRTFLSAWDSHPNAFPALVRGAASHELATEGFRDLVTSTILGPITEQVSADDAGLRATLCGAQLVGVGMARYVIRLEPIVSATPDVLADAVAPTLQRYLTGDISAGV